MTRLLPLAGALLLAAAATAAHASPASDAWIAKTRAALEAKIAEAGLADDGKSVKIRVKLGSAGADAVLIAETSGSADFDSAVKAAAKRTDVPRPPSDLVGRSVTFTLGQPGATATGAN
ncbi:MAG TPA: TonB C-terminal domain-containing protein [Caulobacter sp.]|nr:TonB C-terminal domain-containing protein [Caulobacter sp.]